LRKERKIEAMKVAFVGKGGSGKNTADSSFQGACSP
jgi:hypothetical protein